MKRLIIEAEDDQVNAILALVSTTARSFSVETIESGKFNGTAIVSPERAPRSTARKQTVRGHVRDRTYFRDDMSCNDFILRQIRLSPGQKEKDLAKAVKRAGWAKTTTGPAVHKLMKTGRLRRESTGQLFLTEA